MKAIQLQCTLLPLHSQPKHRKQLETPKQLLPYFSSNIETLRLSTLQKQRCRFSQARTKAMHTSTRDLVFALASPTKSPEEVTAFVATSVVLLVMYWVSNFVAPEFLSKYFEFDKGNENQKGKQDDDDNDDDDVKS